MPEPEGAIVDCRESAKFITAERAANCTPLFHIIPHFPAYDRRSPSVRYGASADGARGSRDIFGSACGRVQAMRPVRAALTSIAPTTNNGI